jgi:murein biosynthesis integral membrane protein MurJ
MLGDTAIEQPPVAPVRSANRQIIHALMSIASATLLIRVFGMGMQIAITARFGLGASMDAYFIAVAVPVLVAGLVINPLESAVVPVYMRVRSGGNREELSNLFSTVFNVAVIAALAFTALMLVFRHQVVWLSAPGADSVRQNLAAGLAPVIFPALILTVMLGVLESILNAEGQFGWPAYAGLLVPFVTTIAVLAAGRSLGVITLGIGALIGLLLQMCMFVVRVRRARITYRPAIDLHHPALAAVGVAIWPLILASCVLQISPLIDQMFASGLSPGSISSLNYALKLLSVPTGVVFVAVGRATLPFLARHAAVDDMPAFKSTLRLYVWIVAIATALFSLPMLILAQPVIQILFQRGAFTASDTSHTAITFMGFVIGFLPMAIGFLLARTFSALGKTRVLLYVNVVSVVSNTLFDYIFARLWQSFGIALATSAVYICTLIMLIVMLRRTIGRLGLLTPPSELVHLVRSIRSRGYETVLHP